jgi:LysM repeat protein
MSRILDLQVKPVDLSYNVTGDSTHLKGFLEITLVYVGSDDESKPTEIFVNEWSREYGNALSFDLAFEIGGNDKTICVPKVSVEHIQAKMASSHELQCRLELLGELKVIRIIPKDIVTDATPMTGEVVDTEKYLLNLDEFFGDINGNIAVDLEITIPPTAPEIERILAYRTQLRNVNVEANDGKILIDGKLDLWLEYIAANNDRQRLAIGAWETSAGNGLPVAGILDFEGLQDGALVWAHYNLENTRLEIAGERTLRLTGTVQALVVGKNPRAILALRNFALVEPVDPESRPSMLFYVVQPGETMWKIARRYQTTVASIAKANQILNPERLEAGQKLIIPKRILA